jgi:glycosyltransferase involved in cell wall biosynthesis
MQDLLIVATLLTGDGPTGVETHFNQIVAEARKHGIEARVVSAQHRKDWRRRVAGLTLRLLRHINGEWACLWGREVDARHLERQLHRQMANHKDRRIILDAQDTLSARAALRSRPNGAVRVVMTVHFNVSEANELAAKGLTTEGGLLWNRTMHIERDVLPRLARVIFVSDFMRRTVLARRTELASEATSVISNFCASPSAIAPGDCFDADLIAIGTLEPRKNQRFLLDVLSCCRQRGRRYTLSLVGDGPDAKALRARTVALGLTDQVRFLGHQPQAARLIGCHRVLVHGALMENLPITLIEAMACGRPVLAAAVGGIPEVLQDGVQGFHWPLDAPQRAAEQLEELLESPALWKEMAAAARRRFEDYFSPEILGPQWLTAILG